MGPRAVKLMGQGGLAMTAEFLWDLFLRTGLPEAYLLYRMIQGA